VFDSAGAYTDTDLQTISIERISKTEASNSALSSLYSLIEVQNALSVTEFLDEVSRITVLAEEGNWSSSVVNLL
jgi:hypothetical protein